MALFDYLASVAEVSPGRRLLNSWFVGKPDISNNVGPVKHFFEHTSPSTPKSGLPCSLLTSASTTTARS